MTRIKRCPRCGRRGSLHTRWVLNSKKKRYEPYTYVAHYHSKEERWSSRKRGKIGWCYVPKEVVQSLSNSLSNGLSNEGCEPTRTRNP